MSIAIRKGKSRDRYMDLIRQFPLRPIRTESDRDAAGAMMDRLAVRDDLNPGESDYQDVLDDLIEAYDEHRWPMPPDRRTPLQRLKSLLQDHNLTPTDLQTLLGCSQTLVSLILSGKRSLSKANIAKLAGRFGVDGGYFL